MKKITYSIISIIILIFINACTGYKPIYTTNLQFKIVDYSIKSNNKFGKQIYYKLYNLSKSSKNIAEVQSVIITIDTTKEIDNVLKYIKAATLIKNIYIKNKLVNFITKK